MHIKKADLVPVAGNAGETMLVYPTADAGDVQSLERFQIRTLQVTATLARSRACAPMLDHTVE